VPDIAATRAALQDAFENAYREKFASTPLQVAIEFINVRVSVIAAIDEASPVPQSFVARATGEPLRGRRPVYFHETGAYVSTAVYARDALVAGTALTGPAVVEEAGSTLVIAPGASAVVATNGNILLTVR
jgi:N-methylhydantoinase A/oxoprolinase/acetone carboxylase beta subunit